MCSLSDRVNAGNADLIKQVEGELNYYLVELGSPTPAYAHYHAGTASNVYSNAPGRMTPSDVDVAEVDTDLMPTLNQSSPR